MSPLDGWEELSGDFIGHGAVEDATFELVTRVIERSSIAELVTVFRAENDSAGQLGGRPLIVPIETAIALMWLVVVENPKTPPLVVNAASLVLHRLSSAQRRAWRLPDRSEGETQKRWVDRVHASLDSLMRLIDPWWVPDRRGRSTKLEWDAVKDSRDPVEVEIKMERLYRVMNALVHATVAELPARYRTKFQGHRAFDGTTFEVGARGTRNRSDLMSVEPNAWWYRRDGDHKVEHLNSVKERIFGYEATLFAWTKEFTSDPDEFPSIVDGVGLNIPGGDPAGVAVRVARTIHANPDLPPGPLRGDKQYWAHQNIDRFHRPMWAMGFTAVTDYRASDLGLQGEPVDGAVKVDGDLYCPFIAGNARLVTATAEYEAGHLTKEELLPLIDARAVYLLTDKQRSAPGGRRIVQCGAAKGIRSTLYCPLKNADGPLPPGALPLPFNIVSSGAVCDNKNSLTVRPEDRFKYEQRYRYMTREWFEAYGQREVIENVNKDLKYTTALGGRGNLRLHGYGAHFLLLTLCVMSLNIHRINNFIAVDLGKKPRRARTPKSSPAPYSGWHKRSEDHPLTDMSIPLDFIGSNSDAPSAEGHQSRPP